MLDELKKKLFELDKLEEKMSELRISLKKKRKNQVIIGMIIGFLLMVLLLKCDGPTKPDPIPELKLFPTVVTMYEGDSQIFHFSGGIPPLEFEIVRSKYSNANTLYTSGDLNLIEPGKIKFKFKPNPYFDLLYVYFRIQDNIGQNVYAIIHLRYK